MTTEPPGRVWFVAGDRGSWRIEGTETIVGQGLGAAADRLDVTPVEPGLLPRQAWSLVGTTSNERYTTRAERELLAGAQPPLGRPASVRAALLPVRKSADWWQLAQDERRAILAERSRHIVTGMRYLPAVARRLYHSRDLGEPFDFLTWFEYAPQDAAAFDDLVGALRETEEWSYVDREVDVRLSRVSGPRVADD